MTTPPTKWIAMAEAMDFIVNEPEAETEKRIEWLRTYVARGGDITHVTAGAALAGAIITAAFDGASRDDIRCLLPENKHIQGKEDFRQDFARCALKRMHQSAMADDLSCAAETLNEMQGMPLLDELLKCFAFEAGSIVEEAGL